MQNEKKSKGLAGKVILTTIVGSLFLANPGIRTVVANEMENFSGIVEIFDNPYNNFYSAIEELSTDRLNPEYREKALKEAERLTSKNTLMLGAYMSNFKEFLKKNDIANLEITTANPSEIFSSLKDRISDYSSLENVVSDYYGTDLANHYFGTYHNLETNISTDIKSPNSSYDYAIGTIEALADLFSSGIIREEHVKFFGDGFNFYKDKFESKHLDKVMGKIDYRTRISLLKDYVESVNNQEHNDMKFFDWMHFNILKSLNFSNNKEENEKEALRIMQYGFEPIEIPEKKMNNMEKAMSKYNFTELYDSAGINDEVLMNSLIMQESGFNEYATSRVGAKGFSQLMASTGRMMGVNRYIPDQNILGGGKYITMITEYLPGYPEYIKELATLGGYNWGHGNSFKVLQGKRMPRETREYIKHIKGFEKFFLNKEAELNINPEARPLEVMPFVSRYRQESQKPDNLAL